MATSSLVRNGQRDFPPTTTKIIRADIPTETVARTMLFTIMGYTITKTVIDVRGLDNEKEISGMLAIIMQGVEFGVSASEK